MFTIKKILPLLLLALLVGCTSLQDSIVHGALKADRLIAGLEEKKVQADDWKFAYLERPGTGDAIVLIHGFTANKDNWSRMARNLPKNTRIIVPDLTGHGDSDHPFGASYLPEEQTNRLVVFFNKIGVDKFHVIGNSMGGEIAARLAAQLPERVLSVTMIDPGGMYLKPGGVEEALAQGFNPLIARTQEQYERKLTYVMLNPPFMPWPAKAVLAREDARRADIYEKIFDQLRRDRAPLQSILPQIKQPCLLLWGRQDRALNSAGSEDFIRLAPGCQLHIMENTGHIPNLERPAETAELAKKFWANRKLIN